MVLLIGCTTTHSSDTHQLTVLEVPRIELDTMIHNTGENQIYQTITPFHKTWEVPHQSIRQQIKNLKKGIRTIKTTESPLFLTPII